MSGRGQEEGRGWLAQERDVNERAESENPGEADTDGDARPDAGAGRGSSTAGGGS